MKKYLIISFSSLALLLAGVSYATQHTGDTKPPQEMKKDSTKKEGGAKTSKKKCPEGQVYNKKDKKCVAKTAGTGMEKTATAPAAKK